MTTFIGNITKQSMGTVLKNMSTTVAYSIMYPIKLINGIWNINPINTAIYSAAPIALSAIGIIGLKHAFSNKVQSFPKKVGLSACGIAALAVGILEIYKFFSILDCASEFECKPVDDLFNSYCKNSEFSTMRYYSKDGIGNDILNYCIND